MDDMEQIWRSKYFQMGMDLCRILLLIFAILLVYIIIRDIEEVKIANSPLTYFEQKTNSTCTCFRNGVQVSVDWTEFNITAAIDNLTTS